ncbi:hypothetical protein Tco_1578194 [Tanacetum coccineum]
MLVRSMALCSIRGVYVVRSMALCSIGGVLRYVSIMRMLRLKEVARKTIGMHWRFVMSFVRVWCMDSLNAIDFISDSLLLTPLCCDDIHDVMPVFRLAGVCDRLVSEPLVNIELSKRKFVIVCHEKVVRIPLEGDEILRVHGERTQGVVKTLVNTKTRVPFDLVIFREEHQCRLLRREAWSLFEVSVGITEEGEVVTYLRFIVNFSNIVKPLTSLTERNQKYECGAEREEAF